MNQSNRGQASVVYYISLKNDHMKNIKTHAKEYLIVNQKEQKFLKGKLGVYHQGEEKSLVKNPTRHSLVPKFPNPWLEGLPINDEKRRREIEKDYRAVDFYSSI